MADDLLVANGLVEPHRVLGLTFTRSISRLLLVTLWSSRSE